jgi:hypothetical protein
MTDQSASLRERRLDILLVLAILLMALFLRWRFLDTTGIWGDQAFTLNTAMRWVNGGAMPLAANKSSVGFVNPPMIEYLYALALRIWPDVLSVSLLTMISGMVALAATGWAAWRIFGRRAALWALLLMAVNPWSVLYSQLIWNQTMLPVFTALTLAFLLVYFAVEQRPLYLIAIFITAACMTQVHPGSAIQVVAIGIIFLLFWRKLRVWPVVVGVGLFVLLYYPFIKYHLGTGWGDFVEAAELASQPAVTSLASVLISLDLLQAKGLMRGVWGTAVFDTLAAILLIISVMYAIWLAVSTFRRRHEGPDQVQKMTAVTILLVWFALPVLFYLRTPYYLQIYYLLSQFPAHFILIGLTLAGFQDGLIQLSTSWQPNSKRFGKFMARWLVPLPLVGLVIWQFGFNVLFQNDRVQEDNLQVRHVRETIQSVNSLMAAYPDCRLVALSIGHQEEVSRMAFLREFADGERVVLVDGRYALPFPEPCAIYLDALADGPAASWLAANATLLPEEKIELSDETWSFYYLSAAERSQLAADFSDSSPLAMWENVALTRLEQGTLQAGQQLPVRLDWSVQSLPPRENYHIGFYLLTMENEVVAQFDGPGYDSRQWQPGDHFITWFDVAIPADLPPAEYQFAAALYTWPNLERLNLQTGDNTAFLGNLNYSGE